MHEQVSGAERGLHRTFSSEHQNLRAFATVKIKIDLNEPNDLELPLPDCFQKRFSVPRKAHVFPESIRRSIPYLLGDLFKIICNWVPDATLQSSIHNSEEEHISVC